MTYAIGSADVEHPDPISQTVPDEALTIRQILDRFSAGQTTTGVPHRDGKFEDGEFDSLDLEKGVNAEFDDLVQFKEQVEAQVDKQTEILKEQDRINKEKEEKLFQQKLKAYKAEDESVNTDEDEAPKRSRKYSDSDGKRTKGGKEEGLPDE